MLNKNIHTVSLKDSLSSFVKTLTKLVPCSVAQHHFGHSADLEQQGSRHQTVTVGTVLVPEETPTNGGKMLLDTYVHEYDM